MALTLRSKTSVQRSDRISQILDRIITPGTDAANDVFKPAKDNGRSEFETYMEREAWSRVKTERDKDMVLMFGDDDVRIFKRNPANSQQAQQQMARMRSARSNTKMSKQDLVDVSGLIPVALDKKVVDVVTGSAGEFVPYSKEERDRIAQRKQEIALRRQQLANQYVYVSQNATNASPQSQQALLAQQMAELGIQLPTDTTHGAEPSAIPLKAWQTWIPRRSDSDNKDGNAATLRRKLRQRRHHRLNCKYHPFSTNAEMRRLAIQATFPRGSLLKSIERVQHASNGAPNGEGFKLDIADCFAPVELVGHGPGQRPQSQESPMGREQPHRSSSSISAASPVLSATVVGGFGAGAARAIRRNSATPSIPTLNDSNASEVDALLPTSVHKNNNANAFLTEADVSRSLSALEKSKVPSLTFFERPPRPHSVEGTFVDCDCTPRLTDDELDMFGIRDLDEPDSPSSKDKSKKKKKSLLGSASRAEKRLELWHRDFVISNVQSRSALNSLLDEREENRDYIIHEREHLNIVAHEAELSGADFRVSRRHRCTTPVRSSMWTPVLDAVAEDKKHVARNVEMLAALLDHCYQLNVPSVPWEFEMLQKIREHCIENASERQRKIGPDSHDKSPKRLSTPSRPDSRQSLKSRDGDGRKSSFKEPAGASVAASPAPHSASASSENKSVFLAMNSMKSQRQSGSNRPSSPAAGGQSAFTEEFALSILERYGAELLRTKVGADIANFYREQCQMSNKSFLQFLFSKESLWDYCQEVHNLQKRLGNTTK